MQANSLGGNLLFSLILGLFLANSQYQNQYHALWQQHLSFWGDYEDLKSNTFY